MSREPIKRRWADGDDELGALFKKVPKRGLSAEELARGRTRLASRPARGGARWWLLAACVAAGAAAAAAIAIGLRARPVVAGDCAVAELSVAGGARVVLVGPGAARPGAPIALERGVLVVRTGAAPLAVDAAGARVTAAPRSLIEIAVRGFRPEVAAYEGRAAVAWAEGRAIELAAGQAAEARGPIAIAASSRRAELERRLAPGDGTCRPLAPLAPPVEPAPEKISPAATTAAAPAQKASKTNDSKTDSKLAVTGTPETRNEDESQIGAESRLLDEAMSRLRRRHDPDGALAALDDYRARFPDGALRPEADAIRVDALVARGRASDTLVALDAMALDDTPRGPELHVLRGELRANAHRCAEAAADFAAALPRVADDLRGRALYGRGACRLELGDAAGRADLAAYLAAFPRGRFADGARRALASSRP